MNKMLWFLLALSFTSGTLIGYAYMESICPEAHEVTLTRLENQELRKFINSRCGSQAGQVCTDPSCSLSIPMLLEPSH